MPWSIIPSNSDLVTATCCAASRGEPCCGATTTTGRSGSPYNREIWKPAIATAGLPADTTFHDLRHGFASTALAEGVPISEVSRWLGHKSITTTVDLYGHLVPEATGRARDALDSAFARAQAHVPGMCPA